MKYDICTEAWTDLQLENQYNEGVDKIDVYEKKL